jgi:hypothetical protein
VISQEILVWARWADRDSVAAVAQVAIDAMTEWPMRMVDHQELADLVPWRRDGWIWPVGWNETPALAAAEMAIICHIWPEPPDEVLRPATAASKSV